MWGKTTPAALEVTPQQHARTQMLGALAATGKRVYEGTVPQHVIDRRRAANKRARVARRAARR